MLLCFLKCNQYAKYVKFLLSRPYCSCKSLSHIKVVLQRCQIPIPGRVAQWAVSISSIPLHLVLCQPQGWDNSVLNDSVQITIHTEMQYNTYTVSQYIATQLTVQGSFALSTCLPEFVRSNYRSPLILVCPKPCLLHLNLIYNPHRHFKIKIFIFKFSFTF